MQNGGVSSDADEPDPTDPKTEPPSGGPGGDPTPSATGSTARTGISKFGATLEALEKKLTRAGTIAGAIVALAAVAAGVWKFSAWLGHEVFSVSSHAKRSTPAIRTRTSATTTTSSKVGPVAGKKAPKHAHTLHKRPPRHPGHNPNTTTPTTPTRTEYVPPPITTTQTAPAEKTPPLKPKITTGPTETTTVNEPK
jgi:hypothetical protein